MKPAITPWLRPAQGFIDLRMYQAAWTTLDELDPSAQADPETLMLRLNILSAQHKWHEAAALGADYCHDWPKHGDFFLKTAEALMAIPNYEKALSLLENAPRSLHQEPEYHYKVATCACRAGRLAEAKIALQQCFTRDCGGWYQHHALNDPTFEPLWQSHGPPSDWK